MKICHARRMVGALALLILGFAAGFRPAQAQILYGSLTGNVTDASQANVAGAKVSILEKTSGQARETVTNQTGSYTFSTLIPGSYEVRVVKEGFRTAVESQVGVTINSVTRADVSLQVGAVAESVIVTAATAALQTDRSEVRHEMTSRTFENLPVPTGRNYQALFRTLPGFRPPAGA